MDDQNESNANGKVFIILTVIAVLVNVIFYIGDSMKKDSSLITTMTNCFPLK